MKVTEIFSSLAGEGVLSGFPMLFIRVSGCNMNPPCEYCDSRYALSGGKDISVEELVQIIQKSNKQYVCWSGGEPTTIIRDIIKVISQTNTKYHTLETNGTIHEFDRSLFELITVSPKTKEDAKYWYSQPDKNISIKVVTDLESINLNLIEFASMLMPLTTWDMKKDLEIKQRVWWYCVSHNLKYSPRLHVDLFQNRRKV